MLTGNLPSDSNTTNIRTSATLLERACRVWGVNEFIKPIRRHPSVKGTALQEDLNNVHALIRMNAVLLWNLHRCAVDIDYAYRFLAVTRIDQIKSQIRNFSNISRLSFATMGNFFIENIFKESCC